MQIIRGLYNIRKQHYHSILTIGNFDGMHLGHNTLFLNMLKQKNINNCSTMVMLFEPQPQEVFVHSDTIPARLMNLKEKLCFLNKTGIDYVLCIKCDRTFLRISPKTFVSFLTKKLKITSIIIGEDFRFGYNKIGNVNMLKTAGKKYGFKVITIKTYFFKKFRISSSKIRNLINANNFILAHKLLGRPFCLSGRVIKGNAIGRNIGIPTANIMLHRYKSPVNGVYSVIIHGILKTPLYGIANIGTRPTIGGAINQLEVHIFNFKMSFYGTYIKVEFKNKIRNEKFFESITDLTKQITLDIKTAQNFFNKPTTQKYNKTSKNE